MIDGITITPLKKIANVKGDIYHALKCSENSFTQFGEAYFSTVLSDDIKGWKKHTVMEMNLIVPVGSIRFVLFDDRPESHTNGEYFEIIMSPDNYCRLTVAPGIWMAFQGQGHELNLLLNIASIEHSPNEAKTAALESINYNWSLS
jgi:dTDP-4-dehydrorhamnose 3,5-epimerase